MESIEELELEIQRLRVSNQLLEQKSAELQEELQIGEMKIAEWESEAPDAVGSDEERIYIASGRKQTFHRPNCKWAQYIISSPNLIEFGSHREAVEAGYKPCKTCRA